MSLRAESRLGPYQIVGALGAGGMGEVYRARDPRLDRDVAIKVLPPVLAADPAALARFEREAKAVAALSHPNILAIHDVGRDGGVSYAVMELLQGETLRERLTHGALPARKAIEFGALTARALGAAHERGLVHRDVKPDNIFITSDGHLKVLDFGLAKTAEPVGEGRTVVNAPTVAPATTPGMVLGTVGYMAPEQVRGAAVDHRSDIFSLGAVLYEMVTGRRAFARETPAETMTAILKEEPQDFAGDLNVAPALERIIRRCLEKDPRERFHSAHDLGIALETLSGEVATRQTAALRSSPSMAARERLAWAAAAVLLLVSLAIGVLGWRGRSAASTETATPIRFTLSFPSASPLQLGVPQPSLAISPDGKTFVYTALGPEGAQLWTHSLDRFDPVPLAGTGGAPRNVFFSPDGRFIAFSVDGKLKRMPVGGGSATVICDAPQFYGGTWTTRDEIVFVGGVTDKGLWRVPAGGGTPQLFAKGVFSYPDSLPDGQAVIASGENPAATTTSELPIVLVDVASGAVQPLVNGGAYPRFAAPGHVVFLRNNALMAVPFDPATRIAGDTATVIEPNVFMNPAYASGNYAISAAGTLAYVPGTGAEFQRGLITVDAKGHKSALMSERRFFESPRVSPDGERVAVTIPSWRDSIWVYERTRDVLTELTTGDTNGLAPIWTPDGERIVFSQYGVGEPSRNLYWMRADGGRSERLTTSPYTQRASAITPDGRTLIFDERGPTSLDLWTVTLDDQHTARPLLQTRFNESNAALSPDGKWLAYASTQSGSREVYLTSFPSLERTVQVSTRGGGVPVWTRDGRRLYYRASDQMMAVDVTLSPALTLSKPIAITNIPAAPIGVFDVMPDGRLLLVDNEQGGSEASELHIVLNWFRELGEKSRSHVGR